MSLDFAPKRLKAKTNSTCHRFMVIDFYDDLSVSSWRPAATVT